MCIVFSFFAIFYWEYYKPNESCCCLYVCYRTLFSSIVFFRFKLHALTDCRIVELQPLRHFYAQHTKRIYTMFSSMIHLMSINFHQQRKNPFIWFNTSIRSCAWIDVKLVEKQTSWNKKRYHCWWCADSGFQCIFRCILECDTLSKSNSRYGIRCLLSNWGSWKWLCAIRNSRRPKEKSKKSKHHERNWPQFQWNRPKKMQTLSQQFSQYNSHCSLNAEV